MAKKEKLPLIKCYDCERAYLMRSRPVNPIVAECTHDSTRNVASTPHTCYYFRQRHADAVINPMKFLK